MTTPEPDTPTLLVREISGGLLLIPLELIHAGANVRGGVGDVAELAASILENGLLEPIQVTEDPNGAGFTVLDGHRRLAAMQRLHLPTAPALRRRGVDDRKRIVQQLSIHTHRVPFNPIAEAHALHELFTAGMSREAIARSLGRSDVWVRDRLALVHLTQVEQRAVAEGRMRVGEALLLLRSRRDHLAGVRDKPPAARVAAAAAAVRLPPAVTVAVTAAELAERDASLVGQICAYLDSQHLNRAAALVRQRFTPGRATPAGVPASSGVAR